MVKNGLQETVMKKGKKFTEKQINNWELKSFPGRSIRIQQKYSYWTEGRIKKFVKMNVNWGLKKLVILSSHVSSSTEDLNRKPKKQLHCYKKYHTNPDMVYKAVSGFPYDP